MESELKRSTALFPLMAAFALSLTALGAPNPELQEPEGTITGTLEPAVETHAEGYVELRPSWVPNDAAVRLENNAYLGARLSSGWLLAYRQEFQNELAGGSNGLLLGDGWIEYSAYPAAQAGPLTVNAEFHGIVPVAAAAGETKFLGGLRTYVEGIVEVVPRVGLFSRLMPRWNVFGAGVPAAERVRFENQLEAGPYLTFFSDRLTVRLLGRWTVGLLEDAGAPARWEHQIQLTPEVLFQLTPEVVLGLSQASGSMVNGDLGGKAEALATAFRESTWQFIVQVTL